MIVYESFRVEGLLHLWKNQNILRTKGFLVPHPEHYERGRTSFDDKKTRTAEQHFHQCLAESSKRVSVRGVAINKEPNKQSCQYDATGDLNEIH